MAESVACLPSRASSSSSSESKTISCLITTSPAWLICSLASDETGCISSWSIRFRESLGRAASESLAVFSMWLCKRDNPPCSESMSKGKTKSSWSSRKVFVEESPFCLPVPGDSLELLAVCADCKSDISSRL